MIKRCVIQTNPQKKIDSNNEKMIQITLRWSYLRQVTSQEELIKITIITKSKNDKVRIK